VLNPIGRHQGQQAVAESSIPDVPVTELSTLGSLPTQKLVDHSNRSTVDPAISNPTSETVKQCESDGVKPSFYEYQPISEPQGFRLLRLEPGRGRDPLRCTLLEAGLDDYMPYEAISYRWGIHMHRTGVFCNEKTIPVTRNLVEALQVFRRRDFARILWTDAICINQQDLDERSSQVQLMTRIY